MSDFTRLSATIADRYVVEREVGRGGMATVFLARDVKHDRKVALKVLDPELGAVLGAERFLAEIKVTANLQHPNLLPLFDSGEAGGLLFYVMPFVEGESLRAKLEREKQLPVDEAIRISVAIASALDYAHSHGVIHRDLKPENILMQSGQPVVADFGIALAVSNAAGNRITQTGLSLGTPQYMSPEQATGDRVIDGRSDIYSLAAMTYEMLTGEPPHSGTTAQAIIARVLTEKPRSVRSTRPSVPEYVEWTLERGLAKLPADRWATAHEYADALQGHSVRAPGAGATAAGVAWNAGSAASHSGRRARFRDPLVLALAGIAVAAVAALIVVVRKPAPAAMGAIRFVIATPDSEKPVDVTPWPAAISPDGRVVVYGVRHANGTTQLYALHTNQLDAHPIAGSTNGEQPIFSPDGQWVAFEANGKLRKVRLDGSAPIAITDAASNNGADWTTTDDIVLGAEGKMHGLSYVSAAGGELVALTKPDGASGETDHLWPIACDDGKTIVLAVYRGSNSTATLAMTSLSDGKVTSLGLHGIRPLAVIDGSLIYVQADGAVMAVSIDAKGRRTTGKPTPVLDPVTAPPVQNGNSGIFISRGGALVTSNGSATSQLLWLGRDGVSRPIIREPRGYAHPRLSPDGRRIAFAVDDGQDSGVWLYDLKLSTLSKLSSSRDATAPAWSPDGKRVLYESNDQGGKPAFWSQAADGGTPATKLLDPAGQLPTEGDLSPDERSFVYSAFRNNSWDIFVARLDSGGTNRPYVASPANEFTPVFSPDGRWVALVSDESGTPEVYIRSFPDPSARIQVSAGGGINPRWAADGKQIFYRGGSALLAARLAVGPMLQVLSRDTVIAHTPSANALAFDGFDVTRDGTRFVVLGAASADLKLVVVPNWIVELRARLAANVRK